MNRTKIIIGRIIFFTVLLALAVLFIVMGWWLALIIEAVVFVALIMAISFFMVSHSMKRREPMFKGDVIEWGAPGAGLSDIVRDAVEWLETGELWEQTSEDGLLLKGRFVKKEGSHTYALCCHGYKNHRMQDISNQAKHFYDLGHNVFAGNARGHGRSEGRYIGMGCKERRDIVGWINMIVKMDPKAKIFLYGVSMGGATVMTTSGEKLPDNVKCAIEDCGFSSIWDEFSMHLSEGFGVPVFPVMYICNVICKAKYGFEFRHHSAVEQVKKTNLPFLFIHGDADTFVPYRMMKPVFEACASEFKKSVTINGAGHAESHLVDPKTYWREVDAWLEKYL
ncbi:MAG: alpha/beta hydrolase [Eubacterium sp.]|nr:alpha/beta hydrolase [Eubacterium sp.]